MEDRSTTGGQTPPSPPNLNVVSTSQEQVVTLKRHASSPELIEASELGPAALVQKRDPISPVITVQ